MANLEEAAREFLAHRRVAIVGVSRKGDTAANTIFRKMRSLGYEVYAVNPHANEIEGGPCYASVSACPPPIEAVVIGTPASATGEVVRDSLAAGVRHFWMHRSFGAGSVDETAAEAARVAGARVIAGACPMMFLAPVDPAHRCFRWLLRVTGREPLLH